MSSGLNFNYEREVEQLRIAIEFHEQQKGRLESRIRELKNELKSGGGELSLVTGEMGAGTTTSSISIAERDDNPIISNLESLEDAYYAESWAQVEAALEAHSDQQYTILIDEYAGGDDGYEFVQEMLKRGHHVILVVPNRDYLHPWLRDLADTEHYISHREFDGIFPPRRSFDTCEIPRFDFTKPPEAYPRAEFEDEDDEPKTKFAEFFGLTQEEAEAIGVSDEEHNEDEQPEEVAGEDDIFSDDTILPQFHLDELERKLDYNLGHVDGFHDLDWKSKCKLAKIAVENDLSVEDAETVLDPSVNELETILKLSQRDRDSDELPDSLDIADWLEYLLGLLQEGDDARDSDV
ncbi:hypothetical protein [Halorussus marinus]|uniref:hypothetical protein n=1 Tax=Halorussus marinus TaxID=2505976 RepID=UPI00106EA672|nr:hypothetical protein [Halorussus marinus]